MIQRKQSIFLFLAGLIGAVSTWFADLWKVSTEWVQPEDNTVTLLLFLLSAVVSLAVIFLFKNRKLQIQLNTANVFLNVLLIGYLAYSLSNLPGEFNSEKGIGLLVPFVSIILLLIANRFILKDEKLVKSVNRFR
jgi:peptidoglycan/LPS O-acetylase OafA/YrhL